MFIFILLLAFFTSYSSFAAQGDGYYNTYYDNNIKNNEIYSKYKSGSNNNRFEESKKQDLQNDSDNNYKTNIHNSSSDQGYLKYISKTNISNVSNYSDKNKIVTDVVGRKYIGYKAGELSERIIKTEVIGGDYSSNRNAFNFQSLLSNVSSGIAVENVEPTEGMAGISINNTPSRFTGITVDGVPFLSQFAASSYLSQSTVVSNVSAVEVQRTAGSNEFNRAAGSGNINIITKKPEVSESNVTASSGSNFSNLSLYAGTPLADKKSTVSLSYVNSVNSAVDNDKDGFSESPYLNTSSVSASYTNDNLLDTNTKIKVRYDFSSTDSNGGLVRGSQTAPFALIHSNYGSGGLNFTNAKNGSDISNNYILPISLNGGNKVYADFNDDVAGNQGYNDGRGGMVEVIQNKINSLIVSGTKRINDRRDFDFSVSSSNQNYNANYESIGYNLKSDSNLFLGTVKDRVSGSSTLKYTFSVKTDNFTNLQVLNEDDAKETKSTTNSYNFVTPGITVSKTKTKLSFTDPYEYNVFGRVDRNNEFGGIFDFGYNGSFKHEDKSLTSKISIGSGYSIPNYALDIGHQIATTNVKSIDFSSNKNPERTIGFNYSLNKKENNYRVTSSLNSLFISGTSIAEVTENSDGTSNVDIYTTKSSKLVPNPNSAFTKIYSLDLNFSYDLKNSSILGLGFEKSFISIDKSQIKNQDNVLKYANPIPSYKAFTNIYYKLNKVRFFGQVTLFGPYDMDKFFGERWNLNGTQKSSKTSPFFMTETRFDYLLTNNSTLSLGIKNLLDFTQSQKDSLLYVNRSGQLMDGNSWGPTVGRTFYVTLNVGL